MNQFDGIGGKLPSGVALFGPDHFEYVGQFGQRLVTGRHQGITARHRRYFRHPPVWLIAVHHDQMCIRDRSYREVLRCLLEGVQWLLDPSVTVRVAGKSGISQARSRLGAEPLKQLYEAVVLPIAEKRTKGAWYRQWRLVSLDGSTPVSYTHLS